MKRKKAKNIELSEEMAVKDFFDMILPGAVKFMSDHYICGDTYRCVWAVREYPPSTEEQAILSQLADRSNITLRVYNRLVDSMEQRKIIQNATRRNKLMSGGTDVQETLEAENNLKDVIDLLANLRKNREPLLHCAVYLELKAPSLQKLKELQSDVLMELTRSKINIDRLNLRQKEGFLSVTPLEDEYNLYDQKKKNLFTEETLQEVCLALNSMCEGAEARFFNGHTNIKDDKFLCFGVKDVLNTNKSLKDALLFSILSYMTNAMLGEGNCVGAVDELYLFLTNLTAIEYIRNLMKRVRKRNSTVLIASQNIEDFLLPSIREFTKPLFSIPTHQFLFNAGQTDPQAYIRTLQMEEAEFELIKFPERGTCLYRCGNERYLLQVGFPDFKTKMFGEAGGR